nr:hypothetical protein [Tanacetum cinerariifolium]
MAEDASAMKFLVSSFMNYKMVNTRPVMEQYHEMLWIPRQYTQHNLMMDEAISVAEGLRNQELDNNPKGKKQIRSSSVNMVERDGAKNSNNNKNKRKFKSGDDKFSNKKGTITCWKCKKTGHIKKDCRSCKGNDGTSSNGSKDPEKQQGYNSDFMQNFANVLHYVSVIMHFMFRMMKLLDNVLYVPGIQNNIVSEIVLNKCGYKQVLESDKPRGMIQSSSGKIAEDEVKGTDDVPGLSEGIDFFDTYAPVARISTIRLLLALAAIHDLVIHQMDVKTAFLNGDLDEKIYMKQPKGKFDASGKGVIICLYVNDMLIFGTNQDQVNKTKEFLLSKFDMKDLGEAEVILGIRIKQGNNVSQLEYSRAIGCLMYAMINTRPDIAFAVGKLSRFRRNSVKDVDSRFNASVQRNSGRVRNGSSNGNGYRVLYDHERHTVRSLPLFISTFLICAAGGYTKRMIKIHYSEKTSKNFDLLIKHKSKKIRNHLDSEYKKQASMVEGDKKDNTSNSTSVRELGNVSLQCSKLTETNYTTWALMMETLLKAYGIWETIVAKDGVATNEKKEDTLEANDQDKLLMACSNNKTYGKWRGKDFNKKGKESMKWKNNLNARRASTSQGTKDKSKLRCYECGEHEHFAKECTKWKNKQEESYLIYDTNTEPTLL